MGDIHEMENSTLLKQYSQISLQILHNPYLLISQRLVFNFYYIFSITIYPPYLPPLPHHHTIVHVHESFFLFD